MGWILEKMCLGVSGLFCLIALFIIGVHFGVERQNAAVVGLAGYSVSLALFFSLISFHVRQYNILRALEAKIQAALQGEFVAGGQFSLNSGQVFGRLARLCQKVARQMQYLNQQSVTYKTKKIKSGEDSAAFSINQEEMQELEHIKNMIDNLNHELKTPVHSILSFSNIGMEKIETAPLPTLKQYFENINKSGQRLLRIIEAVVTQVQMDEKQTQLQFDKSNLMDIARCAVEEMRGLAEDKNQKLVLKGNSKGMVLVCDAETLIQVMINLLANAIKFSPASSTIYVTLANKKQNDINLLEVSVLDEGVGVDSKERETIFQRNVQGKNAKGMGGAGFGLSIAREILSFHGGKIWVEKPAKGTGALFKFEVPTTPACRIGRA